MKKLLIIIMAVLCIALPNFASDDNLIYNPKTQQWEYNLSELKFEYDNAGKLLNIGNMKVTYLENGRMDYIGNMRVKYSIGGLLKSIGKYVFVYNSKDEIIWIGDYNPIRNKQGNVIQVGDYHIEYEYVYPYGRRIKQLVRY